MNLFIGLLFTFFLLGYRWQHLSSGEQSKRLLAIAGIICFAYFFFNMI